MTKLQLSRESLRQLAVEETHHVDGAGPTYGLTCGCTLHQCPAPSNKLLGCVTVGCPVGTYRC